MTGGAAAGVVTAYVRRPRCGRIVQEDAETIMIERLGDTVGPEHLAQQQQVALGILLGPEHRGHHGTGRIVNGGQERTAGLVGARPGMRAAIDLKQHAHLRDAIPAPPMPGWSTGMGRWPPGVPQNATETRPAQERIMLAGQELGDVAIVPIGIPGGHEGADLHSGEDFVGEAPGFASTGVAMDKEGGSLRLKGGRTLARDQVGKDVDALLLARGEGDGSIGHYAPDNATRPGDQPRAPAPLRRDPTDISSDQYRYPTDIFSDHLHPDIV
ncbi:MAG: hypothetical protein ACKVVP_13685 [Chloroflexota bacterium]